MEDTKNELELYNEYLKGFMKDSFELFIDSEILNYEEFCKTIENKYDN